MAEIVYPVARGNSYVSAPYGQNRGGVKHKGIDIASNPAGSKPDLAAVVTGRIDGQGYEAGGAGNWLWLLGDDGSRWKYFHCDRYLVANKTRVFSGQSVAVMGTTGNSTGVHLHLEKHAGGWSNWVDPTPDLNAAQAANRYPFEPAPIEPPITEDGMADQFQFPDGTTYALSVSGDSPDTGFAWVWIGGPAYVADGQDQSLVSTRVRPLAQGSDSNDALFERHPVLTGPHKRATHS